MPAKRKKFVCPQRGAAASRDDGSTRESPANSHKAPTGRPPPSATHKNTRAGTATGADRLAPEQLEALVRDTMLENNLIPKGATVVVAVSGGPDSMVLLHLLAGLATTQNWRLIVAHFNHLLRGEESDLDEAFVAAEARKLGFVFERGEGSVSNHAKRHGLSMEMAARTLRHNFLVSVAQRYCAHCIAFGHHADDQIETVILRILRGSGGEGLKGMRLTSASEIDKSVLLVRPLLGIRRDDLENFAIQRRIPFRRDSSNALTDIVRNWVRQELLPLLERRLGQQIGEAVLRMADLVGTEADFVTEAAQELLACPERLRFETLHCAVQRRVVQLQLRKLGVPETYELIEDLRSSAGRIVTAPGGIRLCRDTGGLIRKTDPSGGTFNPSSSALLLSGKTGETVLDGVTVRWTIHTSPRTRRKIRRVSGRELFDADRVGSEVVLRHWQPGDRFRPIGLARSAKLQDIFVNAKVPRPERYERLVAESPSRGIFWVEGLRIGDEFKVRPDTERILEWRWFRSQPSHASAGHR